MSNIYISDSSWQLVKKYFDIPQNRGRPRTDPRLILDALAYFMKTGCQWRFLPKGYPPWQTVYTTLRRWIKNGLIDSIFNDIGIGKIEKEGFLDAMFIRGKGGKKFVGPTKCGKGLKLMALVNKKSKVNAIALDSAKHHEIKCFENKLLKKIKKLPSNIIGDKAYDSSELYQKLKNRKCTLIAPHKKNRKSKPFQDGRKLRRYKRRWRVENFFCRIQFFRRVMVVYERNLSIFNGLICLAITFMKIL